jgi:hypothetical protein
VDEFKAFFAKIYETEGTGAAEATLVLYEDLASRPDKKPPARADVLAAVAAIGGESTERRIARVFKKIDASGFGLVQALCYG